MSDLDTRPPAAPGGPPPPTDERSSSRGGPLAYLLGHQSWVVIAVALIGSALIGALLIRNQGVNPMYAYQTLFTESFGSMTGITRTLEKTTPLILTGLAVVLPLRVGLFNIGGQGQLLMGGVMAAVVSYAMRDLGFLSLIGGLVAGILFGAMVGSIAALLKTWRGVHEVITTIMLNNIAYGIIWWMVAGPFQNVDGSGIPKTHEVPEGGRIPIVGGVPLGFPVAIALALLCAWMLKRTTMGFRFDTVGKNKHAAGYAGIPISRIILLSMVFAGGLAGLAGAVEVQAVMHQFEPALGGTLGFDGITIALLARSNPIATIPAALLVGALRTAAPGLQFATGIAPEIVDLLLAITLLLVSIPVLGKWIFRSRADKVQASATSWGS